jgi:hypothetical protein
MIEIHNPIKDIERRDDKITMKKKIIKKQLKTKTD